MHHRPDAPSDEAHLHLTGPDVKPATARHARRASKRGRRDAVPVHNANPRRPEAMYFQRAM